MPHSYAETLTLTCNACGHDFDAQFWLIVDAAERPDLLARIRAGALHELVCPHCGDAGHMDAPLLLFRPDDEPVLLFSPRPWPRARATPDRMKRPITGRRSSSTALAKETHPCASTP